MAKAKSSSKKSESLKNNSDVLSCPKCNRKYKLEANYERHVADCDKKRSDNNGGARDGAGRPKGSMNDATKMRMAAKKLVLERIANNADALLNAQMSIALGTTLLFKIEEDSKGNRKKPEMVDDVATVTAFIEQNPGDYEGTIDGDDATYYFITTKVPDNRALKDMFDRAFGKPEEKLDLTTDGKPLEPVALDAAIIARMRNASTSQSATDNS